MKTEFKVGDRVAVYATLNGLSVRSTGTALEASDERLYIEMDELLTSKRIYAHPKQCRRIVAKKRRSVWIRKDILPKINLTIAPHNALGVTCVDRQGDPKWVEFREVKRK